MISGWRRQRRTSNFASSNSIVSPVRSPLGRVQADASCIGPPELDSVGAPSSLTPLSQSTIGSRCHSIARNTMTSGITARIEERMERRLGRGLGSLLGSNDSFEGQKQAHELPLDAIRPNPHQPRRTFDPVALEELTESIRRH